MKVAILTEAYPSTAQPDSRAFVHARARLYQELGHQVQVFVQEGPTGEDCFEQISTQRADNVVLRNRVALYAPDVLAFHTPYAGIPIFELVVELQNRYRTIAWIHGHEAMYTAFQGYHSGWRRLASIPWDMRKLRNLRRFLSNCEGVVYVSQWLQQLAERGMRFHHANSRVIHNPVDTNRFLPPDTLTAGNDPPIARGLALRSLGPKYGLDIGVRAYANLSATQLSIIGTGPLEASLRRLIDTTDSNTELITRGYPHAQIPQIMHEYDYFVSPSRNETQGVAMCEAMACGLPVVATRVGGIPEFVRDGVDGYLVPPDDPAALREAVLRLVRDPEGMRTMGRNARQHIVELCDGQMIAQQELAVLQLAANRGAPPS